MKKIEAEVKQYLEERKWDNLRPGDVAKSITIEAAELLELFQWSNPELADVKKDNVKINRIKEELADVLLYCIDMSVLLEFDTQAIVLDKLKKVKKKFPAELFYNRDKNTEAGSEDIYWKIKNKHRNK